MVSGDVAHGWCELVTNTGAGGGLVEVALSNPTEACPRFVCARRVTASGATTRTAAGSSVGRGMRATVQRRGSIRHSQSGQRPHKRAVGPRDAPRLKPFSCAMAVVRHGVFAVSAARHKGGARVSRRAAAGMETTPATMATRGQHCLNRCPRPSTHACTHARMDACMTAAALRRLLGWRRGRLRRRHLPSGHCRRISQLCVPAATRCYSPLLRLHGDRYAQL